MADAGHEDPARDGTEPDPRFTFANERTFLAWSRTALALVVAGLGAVQLLPPFPGVPWGRHAVAIMRNGPPAGLDTAARIDQIIEEEYR